jgi:hypothetical protein
MFSLIHRSQYRWPQLVWNGVHKTNLQKVHLNSSCNGWTNSMSLPFAAISIMKDKIKMSLFSRNIYDFNFESIMFTALYLRKNHGTSRCTFHLQVTNLCQPALYIWRASGSRHKVLGFEGFPRNWRVPATSFISGQTRIRVVKQERVNELLC